MTARGRRAEPRTKPTQAGSPRALDRWQREVEGVRNMVVCVAIDVTASGSIRVDRHDLRMIHRRLTRVLASMRRSEGR